MYFIKKQFIECLTFHKYHMTFCSKQTTPEITTKETTKQTSKIKQSDLCTLFYELEIFTRLRPFCVLK